MKDEWLAWLSPQEERILTLVANGKTNHEIVDGLHLAEKTVKNYVRASCPSSRWPAGPRPPRTSPATPPPRAPSPAGGARSGSARAVTRAPGTPLSHV